MPKWLEEVLQSLQIFAQFVPILTTAAGAFGAKSANVQGLVTTITNDPAIPAGVQSKVQKHASTYLEMLAKAAPPAGNGQQAPATS